MTRQAVVSFPQATEILAFDELTGRFVAGNATKLTGGRVNEVVYHEVTGIAPTSYVDYILAQGGVHYRYVGHAIVQPRDNMSQNNWFFYL